MREETMREMDDILEILRGMNEKLDGLRGGVAR